MKGRRREDQKFGILPPDLQPGDYWKYINDDGEPIHTAYSSNLMGTVWGFMAPTEKLMVGTLQKHTVREHDDETISVRPGDGSSNSILISRRSGDSLVSFHGYIEHGEWRFC